MLRFIQELVRGQKGPYLQAMATALLLAALVYTVMLTTGCYEDAYTDSPESTLKSGQTPSFQVRLQANARQAGPGERATRTMGGTGDPAPSQVSYRWTPPYGATNLSFNPPPEPGGPPYVWLDRAPDDEIDISYDQPSLPPGESAMLATDTALAEWDGQSSAASFTTLITNEPLQRTWVEPLSLLPPAAPARTNAATAVNLWQAGRWVDPPGITLTTAVCQDWIDFLQGDDVFVAARMPVSPTAALTESYPLPVVFGGEYSNTLQVIEWGNPTPIITVPVDLRPERFTFLANALPSAPGEHWVALGLATDPFTCPSGLELPADRWSFLGLTQLDLTHQPNNCEGCVLQTYYCYEGEEQPSIFGTLASAARVLAGMFAGDASVTSYQGWGITCLGPQPLPLETSPTWMLGGSSATWATATLPITLHHYIGNLTGNPMTFTLDHTSTLGIEWNIYGDTGGEPDLGDPITQPITVVGFLDFWMISEQVPTNMADSPHTLIITATSVVSPADSAWTSDLIWVGDWVAPPPPPGYDYRVYLPLVLRSF